MSKMCLLAYCRGLYFIYPIDNTYFGCEMWRASSRTTLCRLLLPFLPLDKYIELEQVGQIDADEDSLKEQLARL